MQMGSLLKKLDHLITTYSRKVQLPPDVFGMQAVWFVRGLFSCQIRTAILSVLFLPVSLVGQVHWFPRIPTNYADANTVKTKMRFECNVTLASTKYHITVLVNPAITFITQRCRDCTLSSCIGLASISTILCMFACIDYTFHTAACSPKN